MIALIRDIFLVLRKSYILKIISLVPSLTELLFHLGLDDQIVGRTKFCIHPDDKVTAVPKIGGTKNVNVQKVIDLKPDLILANKEENTKSDIEALQEVCNVHVTEIANYKEALFAIDDIGLMTNTASKATDLIESIERKFSNLSRATDEPKICYLIWQNPYMTVGNDTYIHDMLDLCGFQNIFDEQKRYPVVTIDQIREHDPHYIFLSSEPFPFKQKHIEELQKELPDSHIVLVDGEYFSWYGSRMIGAADYFERLIESLEM